MKPTGGIGHDVLADGLVRIRVPASGIVGEQDARRLAWGLLNDLAPDEVVPFAEVVTPTEGHRLDVLRVLSSGTATTRDVADRLGKSIRQIQRRMAELVGDGRVVPMGPKSERLYRINLEAFAEGAARPDAGTELRN